MFGSRKVPLSSFKGMVSLFATASAALFFSGCAVVEIKEAPAYHFSRSVLNIAVVQPIQRKVFKAIESLAKDNNYSFVLDKSKNSNILYADPKYDKSDAIIRKLKK